ncbi:hypothetical protein CHGG_07136 [Chaetomium globosum CBS 148.51]|uniref:Methyltransferase type 11 domain-containing protein n=1 Tax=Chaetomium globosum (strain ATCC 6205 / CBS 148.51 / DSM 1962 / NBRC 6347 / NRRL 1970) TaxID=306901 RepID=Q2GY18_CHAGB|nr:uncharacterized protein CHGG_07136 [Chaetomium globosum CBS 148.51]EAQ85883.1 hypothetical protein CHGG_07136 [Chaetomium globosum CBS 148.51]
MSTSTTTTDTPTPLSTQYDTPLGLAHTTMQALKDRIKLHYDLASDYYLSLWGEHIHHGYWPTAASKAADSKETAQLNLIRLLLAVAEMPGAGEFGGGDDGRATTTTAAGTALEGTTGSVVAAAAAAAAAVAAKKEQEVGGARLRILDVGCGVGGTARYLARELGAAVTGLTISGKQVDMATRWASTSPPEATVGRGDFDVVWISEALSHFPNKALFFQNSHKLLRSGGKLVLADWFKAEDLTESVFDADIKPIEDGMLTPPLCTQQGYVDFATGAGLKVLGGPKDISKDVSKTWYVFWRVHARTLVLTVVGTSRGRSYKTLRCGHSPSAKGEMALPSYKPSGP